MNRFAKIAVAVAAAILAAPSSAFAGFKFSGDEGARYEKHQSTFQNRANFVSEASRFRFNGDEGARFERRSAQPSGQRTVSIVAGSFKERGVSTSTGSARYGVKKSGWERGEN